MFSVVWSGRSMLIAAVIAASSLGGCKCEDRGESSWDLEDGLDAGDASPVARVDASEPDAPGADVGFSDVAEPPPKPCFGAGADCLANCEGRLPGPTEMSPEDGDTDSARLALDATGCPHVGYFQQADSYDEFDVKYARWDGRQWETEVVATASAFDWLTGVSVDEQERPSMVYVTNERRNVHFAQRDASGVWQTESVGRFTRIYALRFQRDPAGRPVVLVAHQDRDGQSYHLTYLERAADGGWSRQEAVTTESAIEFDGRISFDAAGQPHLGAKTWAGDDSLVYAYRDDSPAAEDGNWNVEVLTRDRSVPHVGLVLDQDDRAHLVACRWSESPALFHHWRTDAGWQSEVIDPDPTRPYSCGALAYDGDNRLHTLYGVDEPTDGLELYHAVREDGAWATQWLGTYVRGDVELLIDPRLNVAQALAMAPMPGERPAATARVARYFTISLD